MLARQPATTAARSPLYDRQTECGGMSRRHPKHLRPSPRCAPARKRYPTHALFPGSNRPQSERTRVRAAHSSRRQSCCGVAPILHETAFARAVDPELPIQSCRQGQFRSWQGLRTGLGSACWHQPGLSSHATSADLAGARRRTAGRAAAAADSAGRRRDLVGGVGGYAQRSWVSLFKWRRDRRPCGRARCSSRPTVL